MVSGHFRFGSDAFAQDTPVRPPDWNLLFETDCIVWTLFGPNR